MRKLSAGALIVLSLGLVRCEEATDTPRDAASGADAGVVTRADGAPDEDAAVIAEDAAEAADDDAASAGDDAASAGDDAASAGDGAASANDGAASAGDGAITTDAATTTTDGATPDGAAPPPDAGPHLIDLANLTWSVQSIIDQTATVFGAPQTTEPRNVRGLARSPDGAYLYAGYASTASVTAEVRRIALAATGTAAFVAHVVGYGGKAIAVDDVGRVYVAGQSRVSIFSPALDQLLFTVEGLDVCEGLATAREAGALVLYTSERRLGVLERWVLTEAGAGISAAARAGWGGAGRIPLGANADLRSVRVDPAGRIWVAGLGGGVVFRVSSDGLTVASATVAAPFDLGFDSTVVIVTHGRSRQLDRLDMETLAPLAPIASPAWAALDLVPTGKFGNGALSGLVVIPGVGLYVANESGATLPYPSPADPAVMIDDNDPILWAVSP